jgi:hypothetical protein
MIRRQLPKLSDDQLRRLHYDIDAELRSRADPNLPPYRVLIT